MPIEPVRPTCSGRLVRHAAPSPDVRARPASPSASTPKNASKAGTRLVHQHPQPVHRAVPAARARASRSASPADCRRCRKPQRLSAGPPRSRSSGGAPFIPALVVWTTSAAPVAARRPILRATLSFDARCGARAAASCSARLRVRLRMRISAAPRSCSANRRPAPRRRRPAAPSLLPRTHVWPQALAQRFREARGVGVAAFDPAVGMEDQQVDRARGARGEVAIVADRESRFLVRNGDVHAPETRPSSGPRTTEEKSSGRTANGTNAPSMPHLLPARSRAGAARTPGRRASP